MDWRAEPASRPEWEDLLGGVAEPTIAQTPIWMDAVLAEHGGSDATRVYRAADGRRLILPLVRKGPRGWLSRYRALPYGWGNPGLLADAPITADDIRMVFEDLGALRGLHVGVQTGLDHQSEWRSAAPPVFRSIEHIKHSLDISQGFDHFWNTTLSGATRTKTRKAEKLGVEVSCEAGVASLPIFYEIYERWIAERALRRGIPKRVAIALGRRRDPLSKFAVMAEALGSGFRVWVAMFEGGPIAANVQMIYGSHSYYWRGYGLRGEAGRTRATYLLQMRMIEEACVAGCQWHHMDESGGIASLVQFKTTFGAEEYRCQEYYRERLPYVRAGLVLDSMKARVERGLTRLKGRK